MKEKTKAAITGVLGGLTNGLFGAGGGLFIVPLFIRWLRMAPRKAFASSVAVVLPLSLISACFYVWKGSVDFSAGLPFFIGGAIGGIVSSSCFKKVSVPFLRKAFALLILYGGIRAVFFS